MSKQISVELTVTPSFILNLIRTGHWGQRAIATPDENSLVADINIKYDASEGSKGELVFGLEEVVNDDSLEEEDDDHEHHECGILDNGTMVDWSGILRPGICVFITEPFNLTPLPDGEYILQDGRSFTIDNRSVSQVTLPVDKDI